MAGNDELIYLMRPNVGENELELIKQVIESGYLAEGPMVREFEKEVSEFLETQYAIACTSATTGIELVLRALNIGDGDEVIVPDFTHPATALVVQTVGATPVLVDVDLDTRNTDAVLIEAAINEKTKAVIPVSIFGHPLDMAPINDLKDKYNIHIIEDAACSLGSEYNHKKVGSLTDLTVFSFHPRKIFTTGDGGLVTTDNEKWAALIRSMKAFGAGKTAEGKPGFVRWGTNYRMSNIHGAIALGQIRRIDEILKGRIERAKIYNDLLSDTQGIKIPEVKNYAKTNYQTYAIYMERDNIRDEIIAEMKKKNIQTQIGTYALHTQPAFKNLQRGGTLENSYKLYTNLLALPLHHELTLDDQERVVDGLEEILKRI